MVFSLMKLAKHWHPQYLPLKQSVLLFGKEVEEARIPIVKQSISWINEWEKLQLNSDSYIIKIGLHRAWGNRHPLVWCCSIHEVANMVSWEHSEAFHLWSAMCGSMRILPVWKRQCSLKKLVIISNLLTCSTLFDPCLSTSDFRVVLC